MILKIEDAGVKLFFGGVEQVNSRIVNCTTRKELEELIFKSTHDNICPLPNEDADGKINFSLYWIVIQPGQKVIAAQGEAYLINEVTGKTIDRL